MPMLPSALAPDRWHPLTAIEPSDAAEPITAALARQERMLAPRTLEAAAAGLDPSTATLVGAGSLGASVAQAVGALGAVRGEPPYLLSAFALYPLAAPTVPSAGFSGSWEAVRDLASIAIEPLGTPTQPAGLRVVFDPMATRNTGVSVPTRSRAYRTFAELAGWLGMTQEETARLLGIGRTTALAWRRGHEPRPASARRLYQTHALIKTLVRRLGRDDTRRWLDRGDPSPLQQIAAGDVARADDHAEALIFGTAPGQLPLEAWSEEPGAEPAPITARAAPPRRVRRSAPRRRAR